MLYVITDKESLYFHVSVLMLSSTLILVIKQTLFFWTNFYEEVKMNFYVWVAET